jgi:hypothetical protein
MLAPAARVVRGIAYATAIAAFISANAYAQVVEEAEEEVIEEIVVIAGEKPGDPVDVDALYEEMMRDMLMIDLDRLKVLEDDLAWRKETDKTINADSSSRIKWGYDPQDELSMRNDLDMSDVQGAPTKPATVFRFEF